MNNQNRQRSWSMNSILRDMGQAGRLLMDPKVPTMMKLLLPVAAMIYLISPLDLLPGLPFDDIAVLIIALRVFVQMAEQTQGGRNRTNSYEQPGAQTNYRATDDGATGQTIETSWRVVED